MDPETRELRALSQSLNIHRQLAEATGSEPAVIVQPSDEATSQRFMDVMNCLAAADVRNVSLTGSFEAKAH